jgi:ligand-binding sensor protein
MIIRKELEHLKKLTKNLNIVGESVVEKNKQLHKKLLTLSEPTIKTENLILTDIIDLDFLQILQDKFSDSYNIASVIYNEKGVPITNPSNFSDFCRLIRTSSLGLKRCESSKKRHYEMTIEKGGACLDGCKNFTELLDGAVPFYIEGRRVGTWCAGQRKVCPINEDKIKKYAAEIEVDSDELLRCSMLLSKGTIEEYQKIITFLDYMCTAVSFLGLRNTKQAKELYKIQNGNLFGT